MKKAPAPSPITLSSTTIQRVSAFFYAVVAAAIVLALGILLLPDRVFLAFSNYLQILAAMGGSLVFLYAWQQCGRREAFLYGAGGFGLWGIANIAWYVNVFFGQRALVFPSIIDLGMIASFLLLAIAFRKGLPIKPGATPLFHAILAFCLVIPAMAIVVAGLNASTLITLAYFFACGAFLMIGLKHSLAEHPALLVGSVLFAVSFMIYPLRELFFLHIQVLSIIGTFVAAGFSLMIIGWLSGE